MQTKTKNLFIAYYKLADTTKGQPILCIATQPFHREDYNFVLEEG